MDGRDEGEVEGQGVSRRTFLVLAGAMSLGRFPLPPLDSDDDGPGGETRRLLLAPSRWGPDDRNLLWTEVNESGEAVTMMWMPETPEEVEDLEAFAAAAAKVDWDNVVIADVPMPSATRRFELNDASSSKFWEIETIESGFEVRYGKIGTKGQSQKKAFPTPEAAKKAADKLFAEKVGKGYIEVGARPGKAEKKQKPPREGPVDWTTLEAWQEVFDRLKTHINSGQEIASPSVEEMDAFEARFDFRLPASYRAFVQVFGPGHFTGGFEVYSPDGPKYHELGSLQSTVAEIVDGQNYDFVSADHKNAEPVTRMIFFAEDVCPLYYGWDFSDVRDPATHEYAIRQYDFEYDICPIVATSFPEFINDCILQDKGSHWRPKQHECDGSFLPCTRKKSARPRPAIKATAPKPVVRPKKPSPVEERALMLAIAADPGDPAPQLAYADWLDAYKNKLGELIRLRLAPDHDDATAKREAELIAGLGKTWDKLTLEIGLVPAVLNRLGAKVQTNDRREVDVVKIGGDLVNLRLLESLSVYPSLRELVIHDYRLGPVEVEAISKLESVRDLHLHSTGIDDDLFQPIGRMANLESLCIGGHRARGDGLIYLRKLAKLESLTLGARDGDEGWMTPGCLAHLEALPALRKLFLHDNEFGGKALAPLGRLHRLEALGFGTNPVHDDDLAHLSGLVNLTFLELERTKITGAGLVHLEGMSRLEILRIARRPIGDIGMASIGKLTNLRELNLDWWDEGPRITDAGGAHLRSLTRLVEVDLGRHELTDATLDHFAGMADLEKLDLAQNEGIVGPGLVHLRGLSRLKDLDLSGTGVTDAALPDLLALTSLKDLDLEGTKVSVEAKRELEKAFPDAWLR